MRAFISYSHRDERWLERLTTHLSVLRRDGRIEDWFDREILAGSENRQRNRCATRTVRLVPTVGEPRPPCLRLLLLRPRHVPRPRAPPNQRGPRRVGNPGAMRLVPHSSRRTESGTTRRAFDRPLGQRKRRLLGCRARAETYHPCAHRTAIERPRRIPRCGNWPITSDRIDEHRAGISGSRNPSRSRPAPAPRRRTAPRGLGPRGRKGPRESRGSTAPATALARIPHQARLRRDRSCPVSRRGVHCHSRALPTGARRTHISRSGARTIRVPLANIVQLHDREPSAATRNSAYHSPGRSGRAACGAGPHDR